jgi:hypothetical protein
MISEAQNGIREKKSTNTAIQTFIEDIQKALDKKLLVMGIVLDLTKAFDVINHKLLYRAIGLVLDFIHRLVCGRQKIPQHVSILRWMGQDKPRIG